MRRAVRIHPITALQSEYSLWSRDIEQDALPACQELGVGLVAYSPLGRGFLTGAIRAAGDLTAGDRRHQHPRFQGDNLATNGALVQALGRISRARGCTLAQLALAWVLGRGPHIVPIPGTRSIARLEENVAAVNMVISAAEEQGISDILAARPVAGTRYPAPAMADVNV